MTIETRDKIRKRIVRMMHTLDDDELKLIYYLTASVVRNRTKHRDQKGGA